MSAPYERLHPRSPISFTESGDFQFGGVLYKCALLISPADIYRWQTDSGTIDETGILGFLDQLGKAFGDFLLLGTGRFLRFPSPSFRGEIDRRGLGLETMNTSAACRTYNVLLAEGRLFTAALLSG